MTVTQADVAYAFNAQFRSAFLALIRANASAAFRSKAAQEQDFSLLVDAVIKHELFERGLDPDIKGFNDIERLISMLRLRLRVSEGEPKLLQGDVLLYFSERNRSAKIKILFDYAAGANDYTLRWVETDGAMPLFAEIMDAVERCALVLVD